LEAISKHIIKMWNMNCSDTYMSDKSSENPVHHDQRSLPAHHHISVGGCKFRRNKRQEAFILMEDILDLNSNSVEMFYDFNVDKTTFFWSLSCLHFFLFLLLYSCFSLKLPQLVTTDGKYCSKRSLSSKRNKLTQLYGQSMQICMHCIPCFFPPRYFLHVVQP